MSPESQKYMFIFLAVVVFGLLIGLVAKMMMSCKGVKVDGKCYKVLKQDNPSGALANINNINDGKMYTAANVPEGNVSITLKVKGATAATPKKVKGARITAMAAAPSVPEGEMGMKKNIILSNNDNILKTFTVSQNGKKSSVVHFFDSEQNVTDTGVILSLSSNITLDVVEYI